MPLARTREGVRIHYRAVGDRGPCVILLHGLGLSGRFWFSLPERLAANPDAPVIAVAVDNRGTGRSDSPGRPWRLKHMADDVAAVMDAEGVPEAIVAGISMGGMIAQQVAIRHPDRVRGLILMATSPGMPLARLPALGTLKNLVSLRFIDEEEAGRRLARLLLPESELPRAHEHLAGWREALLEEAASPRMFLYQLGAVASHVASLRLRRIRCPTVVMAGDQDVLVPPRNSEILARLIPGAHLEMLPGVGHGIDILDKEAVGRAVTRILGS